jgi:membrane protein required for colicin V production
MLDFILGLFLAAMLVRGWMRGFVRETLDLVGLVVGLWIAFKLSAPFGDFLTKSFGVTPEVARIGAGIALFVLFGASLSIAAHYLGKVMNLPGLNMVNRVGGSAVALAWGVAIVLVVVNVARVLPLPEAWEQELEDSTMVEAIAGPTALPQSLFESLAGDNGLAALAAIQDIFGSSRAVPEGDEVMSIPPAEADEVRQVRSEADVIVTEIQEFRTGLGLRALLSVEPLTAVAESKAMSSYTSGQLYLDGDCADTMAAADVRVAVCGEGVALAGTSLGAYDGIVDSDHGNALLSDPGFDRVGVSVVDGPTGRLVVIYLGG